MPSFRLTCSPEKPDAAGAMQPSAPHGHLEALLDEELLKTPKRVLVDPRPRDSMELPNGVIDLLCPRSISSSTANLDALRKARVGKKRKQQNRPVHRGRW